MVFFFFWGGVGNRFVMEIFLDRGICTPRHWVIDLVIFCYLGGIYVFVSLTSRLLIDLPLMLQGGVRRDISVRGGGGLQ